MAVRVTHARVEEIARMDGEPVRRNYQITQAYADISKDFRDVLGLPQANWCTFAAWASATAGDFIRADMFPEFLLGKLADNATFSRQLALSMVRATPRRLAEPRRLRDIVVDVAKQVAGHIAEGNLNVFRELAPEFVELISLYDRGQRPSPDTVREHFGARLVEGPSQMDGQTRLRDALEVYAEAAACPSASRRAHLLLYANMQIGFHEQIRLQPAIQEGLDAPFGAALEEVTELLSSWALVPGARRALNRKLRRLFDGRLLGLVEGLRDVYRSTVTEAAMSLRLPSRPVRLGCDVPYSKGGLPREVCVEAILRDTPDLAALMESLGVLSDGVGGSGARDWTRITDRMPFILDLFRATQHLPELFDEPLTDAERASLSRGQTPTDADRLTPPRPGVARRGVVAPPA